jgi:hypothetical protein
MANSEELIGTTENNAIDELSYKRCRYSRASLYLLNQRELYIYICFDSTCRIIIRGHLINGLSNSTNDHL